MWFIFPHNQKKTSNRHSIKFKKSVYEADVLKLEKRIEKLPRKHRFKRELSYAKTQFEQQNWTHFDRSIEYLNKELPQTEFSRRK